MVRLFQEGLRDGNSIKRLRDRLRHLPKDLKEYSECILFHNMKDTYREQATHMFLVTLAAEQSLPLVAYWFLGKDKCPSERRPATVQQTIKRHKVVK